MKQEIFKYDGTQNYDSLIKDNIYYVNEVMVYDLTATFGKGNEPLTIGEMYSRIPYNQPQYTPIIPNITNRQWLESLTDKDLSKEIIETYQVLYLKSKTIEQLESNLEKWLQAEHKE